MMAWPCGCGWRRGPGLTLIPPASEAQTWQAILMARKVIWWHPRQGEKAGWWQAANELQPPAFQPAQAFLPPTREAILKQARQAYSPPQLPSSLNEGDGDGDRQPRRNQPEGWRRGHQACELAVTSEEKESSECRRTLFFQLLTISEENAKQWPKRRQWHDRQEKKQWYVCMCQWPAS